jgi:hypothetical protein
MSSRTLLFRFIFLATIMLVSIPGVYGWTFQNWALTPAGADLPPGTPVTAGYTIHFDSWMTGTTFDKDNSLIMYTDLSNPQWVVKKIELLDDQSPVIEQVPVRQAAQARLDGWTLSYSGKRFDISVQLTGKTPVLNQSQIISVVRLQELTSSAKPVAGSMIKKEIRIFVPTQNPTVTTNIPTIDMTTKEIIEITRLPEEQVTPTKKVTYSPGPEPQLVAGLLAGLVCITAMLRNKT